ncbi:hypothetical protein LBMAG49_26090 [Planctomycetota bacterium]|nr:hypothetical protein LBMAG49_26090 [Planctomycetota bacterium]
MAANLRVEQLRKGVHAKGHDNILGRSRRSRSFKRKVVRALDFQGADLYDCPSLSPEVNGAYQKVQPKSLAGSL